jgi:hypothetical protein
VILSRCSGAVAVLCDAVPVLWDAISVLCDAAMVLCDAVRGRRTRVWGSQGYDKRG